MRWPPVTFTVGNCERRHIGDGAQFVRAGDAAPHARNDRECAVLLDIGVDALVDEARLIIVAIFAGPVADQVIIQRRLAGRQPPELFQPEFLHHRRHAT